MSPPVFACFDVETTGLDPDRARVIEVAVVRTGPSGEVVGEWTTLLDPDLRQLGATHVHGIRPEWLASAPSFLEVAGDLADQLSGFVPVAHNATFDIRFLKSEWEHAGLGPLEVEAVDTLEMARREGLPGRLGQLAEALGVPLVGAHQALDDARALAGVLAALLDRGVAVRPTPVFQPPLLQPQASGSQVLRP